MNYAIVKRMQVPAFLFKNYFKRCSHKVKWSFIHFNQRRNSELKLRRLMRTLKPGPPEH